MSHIRVFRHYIPSPFLLLGLLEAMLLVLSALLGTAVRFQYWESGFIYDSTLIASVTLYAVVLLGSTMAMGVYTTAYREGAVAMAVRTVVSYCLLGCGVLTVIYYFAPFLIMGRGVLALSIIFSLILITPIRWLFFKLVDARKVRGAALVLGVGERAQQLEQRLAASQRRLTEVVSFVDTSGKSDIKVQGAVCDHYGPLDEMARDLEANEIIVALDDRRTHDGAVFPLDELLDCKLNGIRVTEAVTFYERELGILE